MRAPAFQRATAFLTRTIAEMRHRGATRLAAYATLAAQAGVAPMTMLKALRAFRDQGVIALSHGSGATLLPEHPTPESADPLAPESPTRWRRVRQAIYQDMITGHFAHGDTLPSRKILQQRYGSSYMTVRHALEELHREGFLRHIGREYQVPAPHVSPSHSTIVLITFGGERRGSKLPSYQSPRTVHHLHSLQQACVRAGIHLKLMTLHYSARRLKGMRQIRALTRPESYRRQSLLGFMVWDITIVPEVVSSILHALIETGLPVALLNESGRRVVPAAVSGSPLFKQFAMATSTRAGRMVGDFLLSKGHRQIAYLDVARPNAVSASRLEGLREAWRAAGLDSGITVVYPAADTPAAAPTGEMAQLFALADRIMKQTVRSRTSSPEMMRKRLESELILTIDNASLQRRSRERLFAALEQHPTAHTATAWVAYNDLVASYCLDYLDWKGRRVPEDVAVVGFDDSLTAIYHQLTSYNFNGNAYMHAMLEHIINPLATARLAQPVTFEGYLMERHTT